MTRAKYDNASKTNTKILSAYTVFSTLYDAHRSIYDTCDMITIDLFIDGQMIDRRSA